MARILIPLCILVLVGCTKSEVSGERVVTDDLNRSMVVPEEITRVLTLAPSLTESLVAAGGIRMLAAASTADDYPPEITSLPRFSSFPVSYEAILAHEPDLIFATNQINSVADADALERLGIPTYFFSYTDPLDVPRSIRRIQELLSGSADNSVADAFVALLDSLSATSDAREGVGPAVLALVGDGPLYTFGRDSYVHEMIRLAGGKSSTADLTGASPVVNPEFVLSQNPDVIVMLAASYSADRFVEKLPPLAELAAIRNDRLCAIHPDLLSRPGPRLADGLRQLAKCISG